MRAAAPGRLRPEAAGLRQATASPQGLAVSGLSPKQGPTLPEGRSRYTASGVLS
jgi:hypothetical protein